jgi:hypothetical protein
VWSRPSVVQLRFERNKTKKSVSGALNLQITTKTFADAAAAAVGVSAAAFRIVSGGIINCHHHRG